MYVSSLIEYGSKKETAGFVMIRCKKMLESAEELGDPSDYVQILALPPKRPAKAPKRTPNTRVGFNIIALEDTSRQEFFFNYMETTKRLNTINRDHLTQAEILDFQLVQNLGNSNLENLRAMLTGYVDQDDEGRNANADILFGYFASKGYLTSFYETECWQTESFLTKISDFRKTNITKKFIQEKLKLSGISETGTSFAACVQEGRSCCDQKKLLEANFDSLTMNLKTVEHHKVPHFSLFIAKTEMTDFKSLDSLLLKIVNLSLNFKQTLTIITSLQSPSTKDSLPMIVIVPAKTKDCLSDMEWQSMVLNQERPVSFLDLYQSMKFLTKSEPNQVVGLSKEETFITKFRENYLKAEEGLFKEMSMNRQCSDLPRTGFGCVCAAETVLVEVDAKTKLLGLLSCEMFQQGGLCGCSTLKVLSASKQFFSDPDLFENINTVEMEDGKGTRTIVDISVNTNTRKISVSLVASNLDCDGRSSRDEDVLDFIDDKVVEPGTSKTVEGLYIENGIECLFLIEMKAKGVSVVQLVNTCQSQVEIKLDFQCESAYYLHKGEYSVVVYPGRLEPVNMFLDPALDQPVWEYSLLLAEAA